MIKKVAIISLSRGIIGEIFVQHEVKIGLQRLKNYGLEVIFTENALKGMDFIQEHPELRAKDLLSVLKDPSIDMILCAIGGDDTYCIETIFDIFDNTRYSDTVELCSKYELFPSLDDWKGKILLLESSQEKTEPALYKKMLQKLKATGIFSVITGVLIGKPIDEVYYDDYKKLLVEVIDNPALPIVYNVNVGHASPKCIIPFGVEALVDVENQIITFNN